MGIEAERPGPSGPMRQAEIYLAGATGRRPSVPVDADTLAERARELLSPEAYAYYAGGAGVQETVQANRQAFRRWRIVPRVLRDVSRRELGVELFGRRLASPLLLAPVGVQELAHPEADLATARACASLGVPMIFSNQASVAMEETAAAMGAAPRWFQLYWSKSDELTASLVARAERCGCEAIVVTLDTTLLGWRPHDLDLAHLPFLSGKGIAQYTSDPVFRTMLDRPPEEDPAAAARLFMGIYSNPALTWSKLAVLREQTSLPIVLKGVLHPDDALRALDHGVDGIVVSNHGGRQVDGAVASLDALELIAEAVRDRAPLLLDSGVRGGADLFKALALGARAALLGRPFFYGLAIAGEIGVREVIANVLAEFDLTLGLCGYCTPTEISRDSVWKRD